MSLPPRFLDELRARLPLSEIVGRRLRLTRAGREFKACCPFHNEKTPSFYVNDDKGFFHCFGCGAHGDVIGFVMRHDNLAFMETIEMLAGEAGLDVPRSDPAERARMERRKSLYDLMELATRWYEDQLAGQHGSEARAYLQGRGLDAETVSRFRLGYAPPSADGLLRRARDAGFEDRDLMACGLLRESQRGGAPYPFFRNRLMFPVGDRRGRIVAFGARLIQGEGPKYINSAEGELFHKGRILYGLSRARIAAAEGEPIVVVEGYMDVIAMVRAGFNGAVAPLGTAMTEEQIELLWRLIPGDTKQPFVCFDGDEAGRRAAWRAVERLLPRLLPGHSVRIATLPPGHDPDTLIAARGKAGMSDVLKRAQPLADVLWDMEITGRQLESPESRAGLDAALNRRVQEIADRTVQHHYRQEMRQRLRTFFSPTQTAGAYAKSASTYGRARAEPGYGGSYRAYSGSGQGMRGGSGALQPGQSSRRPAALDLQARDRGLLASLINHPVLLQEFAEPLAELEIANPDLQRLRSALLDCASGESDLDAEGLRRHLKAQGFSDVLEVVLGLRTYWLAPFARPDTDEDRVREAWREIRSTIDRIPVVADLREVAENLAHGDQRANDARWLGLQNQAGHPDSDGEETED